MNLNVEKKFYLGKICIKTEIFGSKVANDIIFVSFSRQRKICGMESPAHRFQLPRSSGALTTSIETSFIDGIHFAH
jgi:hypothetical protein